MEDNVITLKKTARIAGLLYLIWVLTGLFGIMYVPSKTIVTGDYAATATKIIANEFIFRTGIICDIFSSFLWVLIGLTLYKLFESVNKWQAKLLVVLVIVQVPAVFIMSGFSITSLMLFKGDVLSTLELTQRQDLGMMFLIINGYATFVLEMYWGLWLFPFGYLVYKSGFIPRVLGVFLYLNGIAYVIHCFSHIIFPEYSSMVFKLATPFWILGEISITLWLLIVGVKYKSKSNQ
jgi:hypothetical protein